MNQRESIIFRDFNTIEIDKSPTKKCWWMGIFVFLMAKIKDLMMQRVVLTIFQQENKVKKYVVIASNSFSNEDTVHTLITLVANVSLYVLTKYCVMFRNL
jgi:high-affinity K+ transport system ATPase subunit B